MHEVSYIIVWHEWINNDGDRDPQKFCYEYLTGDEYVYKSKIQVGSVWIVTVYNKLLAGTPNLKNF